MSTKYFISKVCVFTCITLVSVGAYIKEKKKDIDVDTGNEHRTKAEVVQNEAEDIQKEVGHDIQEKNNTTEENNLQSIDLRDKAYVKIACSLIPYMIETSEGFKKFESKYGTYFMEECLSGVESVYKREGYAPFAYQIKKSDYELTDKEGRFPIYAKDYTTKHYGSKKEFIHNMTKLNKHTVTSAECLIADADYMLFSVVCDEKLNFKVILHLYNGLISSYNINAIERR